MDAGGNAGEGRTTRCPRCGVELPFPPGRLITCPRCAPRPDVAGRIAGELVEAALAASDSATTQQLLAAANAWRGVVEAAADG